MKKILILSTALIVLYSCGGASDKTETSASTEVRATEEATPPMVADEHNARNSLDYQGTYKGDLPTASGSGMQVQILLSDSTYKKTTVYNETKDKPLVEEGTYSWNAEGNTITLVGVDAPNQYFVVEGRLFHLDMDGKKIEGELANKYILSKVD